MSDRRDGRVDFDTLLAALPEALGERGVAVVSAPPGAGKTTRVPLHLLASGTLGNGRLVMLEPRRVAARAAANRMAQLLDEQVGQTVGYRVRHDSRVSAKTRIEVVTEGVLLRMLGADPELPGVSTLVFDEVHERNLASDLALALAMDAREALRPDLRLLLMSATLETDRLADHLDAPVLASEHAIHPLTVHHRDGGADPSAVSRVVGEALGSGTGNVLVFLPGFADIDRVARALAERAASNDVVRAAEVVPLHGALPAAAQDAALRAGTGRRVVLATNVAETSVTVAGVDTVVDSGLARMSHFSAQTGMGRLVTERISLASATQRAGRAARLGPGRVYRLWPEAEPIPRERHTPPEILRTDLATTVLALASWGVTEREGVRWLDSPPAAHWDQARDLLIDLGALDAGGRLTMFGREMAALPMHPRLASMLLAAATGAPRRRAARLAALLDEGSPWRGPPYARPLDVAEAIGLLDAGRGARAPFDRGAVERIRRTVRDFQRVDSNGGAMASDNDGALLALGFPDRIARRRGEPGRFVLPSGRAVRVGAESPLSMQDWLVVPEVDGSGTDARARLAAPLCEDLLHAVLGSRFSTAEEVAWHARSESVIAERVTRLGRLVVESEPLTDVPPDRLCTAMCIGIRSMGLACLPWTESIERWRARVAWLAEQFPDDGWPDLSADHLLATLEEWLAPWLAGITRRSQLARVPLADALRATLDGRLRARIDEWAPRDFALPNGRTVPVHWSGESAPRISIALQWAFGLATTPAVAGGRVPLTLELLSPAGRPLQVTRDLAAFWAGAYVDVRKEMRGRYPKHHWPEDPANTASMRSSLKSRQPRR